MSSSDGCLVSLVVILLIMPHSTLSLATTITSSMPPREPDDHMRKMKQIVHAPLEVHPCTEHHRFYWMDGSQKPVGFDGPQLEKMYSDYGHACEQISSYWRWRSKSTPSLHHHYQHTAADVKSCQEGTLIDEDLSSIVTEPIGSCVGSTCPSKVKSVCSLRSSSSLTKVGITAAFPNFASRDNVQYVLLDPILPKSKYRHGRARLMSLYADSYFDTKQLRRAAVKCDKEHHFKRNAITEIAGEFAKQKCLMRK